MIRPPLSVAWGRNSRNLHHYNVRLPKGPFISVEPVEGYSIGCIFVIAGAVGRRWKERGLVKAEIESYFNPPQSVVTRVIYSRPQI